MMIAGMANRLLAMTIASVTVNLLQIGFAEFQIKWIDGEAFLDDFRRRWNFWKEKGEMTILMAP
jgi:hypothetical protein